MKNKCTHWCLLVSFRGKRVFQDHILCIEEKQGNRFNGILVVNYVPSYKLTFKDKKFNFVFFGIYRWFLKKMIQLRIMNGFLWRNAIIIFFVYYNISIVNLGSHDGHFDFLLIELRKGRRRRCNRDSFFPIGSYKV